MYYEPTLAGVRDIFPGAEELKKDESLRRAYEAWFRRHSAAAPLELAEPKSVEVDPDPVKAKLGPTVPPLTGAALAYDVDGELAKLDPKARTSVYEPVELDPSASWEKRARKILQEEADAELVP